MAILPGIFSSCHKGGDPAFEQSPDERINEVLLQYEKILADAPEGWNATIVPANGATYHYYFRFNNANRVFMRADFDTSTAAVTGESSYRLKALQQPSLLFDTYSYLHLLSDPDASVNGGQYGQGLVYDFEFSMDKVSADSVVLTGRFHGTRLVLMKASGQDRDKWEHQRWTNSLALQYAHGFDTYFTRLSWGSTQYDIAIDQYNRKIAFYWNAATGTRQSFITRFVYGPEGVEFTTPFLAGQQEVAGFTKLSWDSLSHTILLQVNDTPGVIGPAIAPVVTDIAAPERWRQTAIYSNTYWVSVTGFTRSWYTDILSVRSIPGYSYMLYYPRFGLSGNTVYDLAGATYLNAGSTLSVYGKGFNAPVITADGRMLFSLLGTYGTAPSAASVTIMNNVSAAFTESEGYYFVQVGTEVYDMVSAKDARTWIRWQLY